MAVSPVVGGGLVHMTNMNSFPLRWGWGLPNTLLGFETTGPSSLRPFGGTGGDVNIPGKGVGPGEGSGWCVVAPLGGGVWCLIRA
jgi:hypothetical protein